jgi:hypothetical protein
MFMQLEQVELPLHKLNFGVITLMLKKEDAGPNLTAYNYLSNQHEFEFFFTKVDTNRLTRMAQRVIKPTQTALCLAGHTTQSQPTLQN